MKRKILLSTLCVALIVSLLGFVTACDEQEKNPMNDANGTQSMEYKEVEGGYSLVGIGKAEGTTDLIVPETYNGKPIVSIESYAFSDCDGLETVTVKSNVKSIGAGAFHNCFELNKVTLDDSVESIGAGAFNGCINLKQINLPNSLTSISSALFYNCVKLESITMPQSINAIGAYAFNKCSLLSSVTFSENIQSIGKYAFANCVKLEEVELPELLKNIDSYTFVNCTALESVTFADDLESISSFAFSGCVALKNVELNEGLKSIGESAFDGCVELAITSLPSTVEFIDKYAFRNCTNVGTIEGYIHYIGTWVVGYDSYLASVADPIKEITIKDEATGIASFAFSSCKTKKIIVGKGIDSICDCAFSGTIYVTAFNVDESNENYKDYQGCIYSKDGATLVAYPTGKTSSTFNYIVARGVTNIEPYALYYAAKITSINLIFDDCEVESIGDYAFGMCAQLKTVELGKTITSIGNYAFYNCNKIEKINVSEENPAYKSVNNGLYTKDGTTLIVMATGSVLNEVLTVEEGTKIIAPAAFYNAKYLKAVVLPDSITTIGDIAFDECVYLETVYYKGDATSWAEIVIADTNSYLLDSTVYFYSETQPTEEGNFWHYNEEGQPIAW